MAKSNRKANLEAKAKVTVFVAKYTTDKEIYKATALVAKSARKVADEVHAILCSCVAHHALHLANGGTAGTVYSSVMRMLENVPGLDHAAIAKWTRDVLGGNYAKAGLDANPVRFAVPNKNSNDKVISGASKDTFKPNLTVERREGDKTVKVEAHYSEMAYYAYAPSKAPKDWNFDDALANMSKLLSAKLKKGEVQDKDKPRAELAANILSAISKGMPAATIQSMSMVSSAATAGKQLDPAAFERVLH